MKYKIAIVEGDTVTPAVEVVSRPGARHTQTVLRYSVIDGRADAGPIRDLVMDAIISGHADDMIDINGFHDVCRAGVVPWLRFTREDVEQTEMQF